MTRVYATKDDGKRFLLHMTCNGCDATLKPGPDVAKSGWHKTGLVYPDGDQDEWHWCPNCEDNTDQLWQRERDAFILQYGRDAWDKRTTMLS